MSAPIQSTSCFICSKHHGDIVSLGGAIYEDDIIYVTHAFPMEKLAQDVYLGWLIIETKRHAPGLADLTEREGQTIGAMATRLARSLKAMEGAEHIYSFVMGHHVPHFHMHIVPRYPGAPSQYWGMHVNEWPEAPRGGEKEIEALCERMRMCLQKSLT